MKSVKPRLALYAITSTKAHPGKSLTEAAREALEGGITCLQLREKDMAYPELLQAAVELHDLCKSYGVPLIINDNLSVALESGAEGVHLGAKDMSIAEAKRLSGGKLIIGATARTAGQAMLAQSLGADYIGSGAVFPTSTKADTLPLSTGQLKEITRSVSVPVVAIGGITAENMPKLRGSGIAGVAVASGIFACEDITLSCRNMRKMVEENF